MGHTLSEQGIATNSDKTKAIVDWPVPRTVKQLRSFLGFASYYRRYIKGFAKIAKHLHSLVGECQHSSPKRFRNLWSEACQIAFEELKSTLISPPILAFADFDQPFILDVDASLLGLGAVLSHI